MGLRQKYCHSPLFRTKGVPEVSFGNKPKFLEVAHF